MAAAAWVEARRSAGAALQRLAEPVEFLAGQEPLVLLDLEAGYAPARDWSRRGASPTHPPS